MEQRNFVVAPVRNHDNGAVGTTNEKPKRKRNKEVTKKMLMEELSAVKEELTKIRNEKDALLLNISKTTVHNKDQATCSSAPHEDLTGTVNETLLASVNNMSLSTMSIPECVPSEGEVDIDKKGYEYWKNILVASLNLIQATDERTKIDVFRIKAGPKLLELLHGTSSSAEMPDESSHPFGNALARLDCYFGSRAYMLSQRSKLLNTIQQSGETNIQFVRRVAASAKLCGYDKEDDEMEAVARTLIKSSTDKRVRTLAHRNWVKQGSLNDLIDMVRDYETELSNEIEFKKLRQPQEAVSIAAITSNIQGHGQFNRNIMGRVNNGNRGKRTFNRGRFETPRNSCWRCASIYHGPAQCPCIDKVCHNCNRRGHLSRCCVDRNRQTTGKRQNESDDGSPPRKIAAIKEKEENDTIPVDVSEID
ncbi:uncharacterized protein LOC131430314 [Malaya genurostris]|uniref:uncharacterized protein LOC131430314 n=1 Tax=Malaya genurostris TaxID=325434 RepID=UPI0026F3CC7E|nr:uncharacterized protein LOC131430314 [Malaya genurostris]